MGEENLVVFKGTTDGIVVLLDEKAPFDELLSVFSQKLNESKQFFKGSKVGMRFKGRSLTKEEEDQILALLTHQNVINISFLHPFEEEEIQKEENRWIKEQIDHLKNTCTHFHYGIVRSVHHIDYEGNVVILGDVNPGGLITAGGNVIVLGNLKGKVHAGLDETVPHPFIISMLMEPIQLGIRNIIAQAPKDDAFMHKEQRELQIAYLQDEQIYVDQMDAKSLNHMLG